MHGREQEGRRPGEGEREAGHRQDRPAAQGDVGPAQEEGRQAEAAAGRKHSGEAQRHRDPEPAPPQYAGPASRDREEAQDRRLLPQDVGMAGEALETKSSLNVGRRGERQVRECHAAEQPQRDESRQRYRHDYQGAFLAELRGEQGREAQLETSPTALAAV